MEESVLSLFLQAKLMGMDLEDHYGKLKVGVASLTEFRAKARRFNMALDSLRESDNQEHKDYVNTWDKGALKRVMRL